MILFALVLGIALGVLSDRLWTRWQERTADARSMQQYAIFRGRPISYDEYGDIF